MPSEKIVGIHLDLKYTMPNKQYLLEWLKRLPDFGINAVLVEYEDKFPYEKYPFVRDPEAFTPDELRRFLATARETGLQVIPLVQTLSHLEFALAHDQLAHLRETPAIHAMVCPGKPEAVAFVQDLVREVLAYHKEDELFHLGGDEAWHLGKCETCKPWIDKVGPTGIWIEHQKKIMPVVMDAGKRPIYWDDIFWQKPEQAIDSGLPKEMMLHAWNYGITSLQAGSGDATDLEFGGKANALRQVDVYRAAGYESFAGPCCNIGILAPGVEHSLKNTMAWAQKMHMAGMAGMLQTSWAVFHTTLPVLHLTTAGTGLLCANPEADFGDAWQQGFLEREYGAAVEGVAAAFRAVGESMNVKLADYGRPFAPIVYGYMNMVLYFPGRQQERRERGPYPLDWDEIDFAAMYRKGVDMAKAAPERDDYIKKAQALSEAYAAAVGPLRRLAETATRHKDEARLLPFYAEMKAVSARGLVCLLGGGGDAAALRAEVDKQLAAFDALHAPFLEPRGIARMKRAWLEPLRAALTA